MERTSQKSLEDWCTRWNRKPLVIRGARQVGKTFLVRALAQSNFDDYVEVNFDLDPEKREFFKHSNVEKILELLSIDSGKKIIPGKTLLFLDEIQAAPEVFAKLRYFYEKLPEQHIIAAGSLLEFLLAEHEFSMPVGRIEYLFLGPMSFNEYILAKGETLFLDFISKVNIGEEIPASIHSKGMDLVREYWVVGGMPAAVRSYIERQDIDLVHREHQSIHQSYQDDFAKYGQRINTMRLQKVYRSLPNNIARKMKYVAIDPDERAKDIAFCLSLLEKARVIHKVKHTSCNGVPLQAESSEKVYKPLFLDIGLLSASLGLKLSELYTEGQLNLVHKGVLCEQFVGQHLLYLKDDYFEPQLNYWNREKKSSSAEVDFIISSGQDIIPIEVKAGKTGRLRSLQQFLCEKSSPISLRINLDLPSIVPFGSKPGSTSQLISLPFYMIGQVARVLTEAKL
jgi:uncharacterized protein